mmetsp:Transcript_28945/g.33313  ORF Transcript_28945/g.33313 Transcript_28945/m.33313 type:complete len:784 (-) Transcript_28945:145-2496(-)|eukprot:CAMPEP_0194352830 /NCGR_PEP_ID=MMETSP0174-20130528/1263_1 /TAXON_ID=216777 /ORGANISM="Proboscia alata, Strain PI-D3" /LENGTH=783 /DNA_ID=CAMNT_0039121135 /DNA_START=73 /DNA_END=2424 /DNA_ORIENTATION=+
MNKVDAPSSNWMGGNMSQDELMEKDTVITLGPDDSILGSASKRISHVFDENQPRGILHRAFSLFLFDKESGDLLLQKRASTKITFPNVWTNTCCSHPLHGMVPAEVDGPGDVADGTTMGVKHAAVRKLYHELGIPSNELPISEFKFLTRMHYWAADTVTHGPDAPWGEHEIDYVLFLVLPNAKATLTLKPHPEEVDDVKWVSKQQLIDGMKEGLWSPWFRLIVNKWLVAEKGWWENLTATMTTDVHCDYTSVHKFDPPKEHMGGKGKAGPYLGSIDSASSNGVATINDTSKKQGAYGKIKTHKESKLSQISHIDEVFSAISFLYIRPLKSNMTSKDLSSSFVKSELDFCDEILGKVSRSFAAVIRQLPPSLVVDVMIFYLVLRALDTVEDEMKNFASNDIKIGHLLEFHKTALGDPKWTMDGIGEGDERRLLEEFPKCHGVFAALKPESKRIITDITHRMATGMAEFVSKDLGQGTENIKQYNRYCHFVAGLVGEGLSRLFVASGLEESHLSNQLHLSDQMGLFLQKTNIIRDYLEDYVDGRAFWPQSVWKKHSESGDLGYFADPANNSAALACLNELVTDSLELVPDCLAYLSALRCSEVFRFCAIPQVMSIATLDKCYNNPDVFTGVVKIRKGLSCKLILNTNDMREVQDTFITFAESIASRASKNDPSYEKTLKACETILEHCSKDRKMPPQLTKMMNFASPVIVMVLMNNLNKRVGGDNLFDQPSDVVVFTLFFGLVMFMLGYGGMGNSLESSMEIALCGKSSKRSSPILTPAASMNMK